MVGSFLGCCPRAASGHTAAALPSVTTNSRRWMWVAIDPPVGVMPMQRRGRYHALPKGRTMLLRCESLEPPMSEVGQSRSFGDVDSMSGSTPKAAGERTSVDG